ncbi:hypothetical protein ILUMI_11332 [Ignelater luminosus]|uniref:DDE-1 domain-containing protein n=1 Tax=Ignelater luminosus TaxID=2038154 RepID=A0A8K0D0N7_IGNLU|nr:hypothetical protein ILUMI_11332 [Ignelater luminosus]
MERWTTWSNISLLQKWMDDHRTVYRVAKTFCHLRERICGEPRATCDGQSFHSHSSLLSYLFCRKKGIHIVPIPPHASHPLQPLDLTFYGPLKTAFNKECDLFMKARGCQNITPYNLVGLINKAYGRVSTLEKVTKDFERSDIWPLNPETFGEGDFLPARNLRPTIMADEEPARQISVASDDEDTATSSSTHSSALNSTSANLTSSIPPPHTSDTNPSRHPTTNIGILNSTIPPFFGSLHNVTSRKRTTVSVADVLPIQIRIC